VIYMSGTIDWRSRWIDRSRRIAAAPNAVVVTGVVLSVLAVAESMVRAAVIGATLQFSLVLCLLALSTTLPLCLGRPREAAAAITATSIVSLAFFHTLTVAGFVGQLFVLYRFGRTSPSRIGAQLPAAALAIPFLVLALAGTRPTDSEAAILIVLLASMAPAAAWAGIAGHAHREALMQSAAREVIASDLFEHRARGERARIARELHDVVAHHISMVAVQAETARLTTPGMPAVGAQRLSAIGDTARSALTEMRRLLGVLREDAQADTAARQPQPGLAQLNDLLDEARAAAGTGTRLILSGSPVSLDPGVELATYRIAQEALTNARRHAPGAAVDVELHYTADTLRVRIRDNGPGPAAESTTRGHGLAGMRERAVAVGGQLHTGPAPGGGFMIEAALPAAIAVP
jgi:signal transduction histidine kinase